MKKNYRKVIKKSKVVSRRTNIAQKKNSVHRTKTKKIANCLSRSHYHHTPYHYIRDAQKKTKKKN